MPCTDKTWPPTGAVSRRQRFLAVTALVAGGGFLAWLAGCATQAPAPVGSARPGQAPATPPAGAAPGAEARAPNWASYRERAAQRMVAINGERTYMTVPNQPLLAIPVLEVSLNADGSVAKIEVLRHPSQARDTTQLAIDAVKRSAPFGNVSHLPKPWKFVETFLFEHDRRFKPMSLDN